MTLPLLILSVLLQVVPDPETPKADIEFEREVDVIDLATYSTYAWNKNQTRIENLANHIRLINAIQGEMKQKGFRIDTIDPEARIQYRVERHTDVRARSTQQPSVYDPSQLKVEVDLETEETVTLSIEIVDAEAGFLLWRAEGTYPLGTPDRAERQINEAVQDLFAKFPPAEE